MRTENRDREFGLVIIMVRIILIVSKYFCGACLLANVLSFCRSTLIDPFLAGMDIMVTFGEGEYGKKLEKC